MGLQNGETVGSVTLASRVPPPRRMSPGRRIRSPQATRPAGTFNPGNYSIAYDTGALTVNPAALTITADNASKTYGQTVTFAGTEFTSGACRTGRPSARSPWRAPAPPPPPTSPGRRTRSRPAARPAGRSTRATTAITYDRGLAHGEPRWAQPLDHGGQHEQDVRPDAHICRDGIHEQRSAERGHGRHGHPEQRRRARHGERGFLPDNPEQRDGGDLQPRQLHDQLQRRPPHGEPGGADHHGQQRKQSLRPGGRLCRYGVSSAGLQNGETIGSVALASAGAPATANVAGSPYAITASNATGGTFSPANYSITYDPGALTISPAGLSLTITADNASKTYGQTLTFAGTAFPSSGLQNGDTVGSVTLTSAGAPAAANVGAYSIIPSNAAGGSFNPGNYTITYDDGILMVNPAALTITASNASKVYGQALTLPGPGSRAADCRTATRSARSPWQAPAPPPTRMCRDRRTRSRRATRQGAPSAPPTTRSPTMPVR